MELKKKTNTNGLVTTTAFKTKINEVENKILNHGNTTVLKTKLSEGENKILNHEKYITTPEFNKLTAENFTARLKQANLVTQTDFDERSSHL